MVRRWQGSIRLPIRIKQFLNFYHPNHCLRMGMNQNSWVLQVLHVLNVLHCNSWTTVTTDSRWQTAICLWGPRLISQCLIWRHPLWQCTTGMGSAAALWATWSAEDQVGWSQPCFLRSGAWLSGSGLPDEAGKAEDVALSYSWTFNWTICMCNFKILYVTIVCVCIIYTYNHTYSCKNNNDMLCIHT